MPFISVIRTFIKLRKRSTVQSDFDQKFDCLENKFTGLNKKIDRIETDLKGHIAVSHTFTSQIHIASDEDKTANQAYP